MEWSDVLGITGIVKDVGLMILFNEYYLLLFFSLIFLIKFNE